MYYKVRWRGFRAKDDTWLPRKDMNCPKIIERFENILASLSEREEWVVSPNYVTQWSPTPGPRTFSMWFRF